MKIIKAADLFCGAGGTTSGLIDACRELGFGSHVTAINHWKIAIETHSANHPEAYHLCESLDNLDPRKVIKSGSLDLMIASPECIFHSRARGGKPIQDQLRASAWHIIRWCEALRIDSVLIENVPEFMEWGPIGANGRPLKSRKGETYQAFLNALRSLNYTVESKILNAADFGDATSRRRLFIMAKRGRKKIEWPRPTHSQHHELRFFPGSKHWRAAKEIIDWSIPGKSIFSRKRPLKPATINRIIAGLKKFGGPNAEPFLVILRNNCTAQSLGRPLPTITTSGAHFGLIEPFIVPFRGTDEKPRTHSVDQPLMTITTRNPIGLCQPFLIPFFGERDGQDPRTHSIDAPLPTVTGHGAGALIEPFIVPVNHGSKDFRSHDIEQPMPTITSVDAWGLVSPFLVKYYGTAEARPIEEPLDSITTKDRFALVEPKANQAYIDIHFRMLQPHELAAAMSFHPDYHFAGNREDRVKQIGNAVPVNLARHLCLALLKDKAS